MKRIVVIMMIIWNRIEIVKRIVVIMMILWNRIEIVKRIVAIMMILWNRIEIVNRIVFDFEIESSNVKGIATRGVTRDWRLFQMTKLFLFERGMK